jgi:hypothetical protein
MRRSRNPNGSGESIQWISGPGPRARVPPDRLCPPGEPNEAMGPRAPIDGWFPLSSGERNVCNKIRSLAPLRKRATLGPSTPLRKRPSRAAETRNAGCQNEIGQRVVEVRLDGLPHRRQSKRPPARKSKLRRGILEGRVRSGGIRHRESLSRDRVRWGGRGLDGRTRRANGWMGGGELGGTKASRELVGGRSVLELVGGGLIENELRGRVGFGGMGSLGVAGWGGASGCSEAGSSGSGVPRAVTWTLRFAFGARTPW